MTIVKSNLCKQCGGLLDIDLDRQVYICPYCGVTFDYEYFREENVKDIATKALIRNEFGAAKDAYEFMLKKNPHDFEALRGLFFCHIKWKTIHPILNHSNVHFKEDDEVLKRIIERCLPEHREYFEKIREAARLQEKYKVNRTEAKRLEDERITEAKVLSTIKADYERNERSFSNAWGAFCEMRDNRGDPLIITIGIAVLGMLGLCVYMLGWWVLALVAGIIALIIVVYNVNKVLVRKRITRDMVGPKERLDKIAEECNAKRDEGNEILQQYKDLTKDILGNDPMPQKELPDILH